MGAEFAQAPLDDRQAAGKSNRETTQVGAQRIEFPTVIARGNVIAGHCPLELSQDSRVCQRCPATRTAQSPFPAREGWDRYSDGLRNLGEG